MDCLAYKTVAKHPGRAIEGKVFWAKSKYCSIFSKSSPLPSPLLQNPPSLSLNTAQSNPPDIRPH